MGGYQLVHAWELPRNSSHHLITFLIKVTGRLRPVKNKCVDLQQNMYLENPIRAAPNVLESSRQTEALCRPQWKMSVHKGTDSKALGKDSNVLEVQARIQNREKPSNGCLRERTRKQDQREWESHNKSQGWELLGHSICCSGALKSQLVQIGTSY